MTGKYVREPLIQSEDKFSELRSPHNTGQARNRMLSVPFTRSSQTTPYLLSFVPRNCNSLFPIIKKSGTSPIFEHNLQKSTLNCPMLFRFFFPHSIVVRLLISFLLNSIAVYQFDSVFLAAHNVKSLFALLESTTLSYQVQLFIELSS